MGTHHARIYKKMSNVALVGLGENDPVRAKDASQKFGMPVYSDYRFMLEKERPNVVSVTVSASLHEEITITALQSGAHVIVEKPIATTLKAAARMIATARQFKRRLLVGHIERFNPVIRKLKTELQLYDLGEVRKTISRRLGLFPARVQDVGVVLDTAIHDLDLIFFLTNQIPIEVYANTKHQLLNEHEDTLVANLYFEKGFTSFLDVNWTNVTKVREIIIQGNFGVFHADCITQKLVYYPKGKKLKELSVPYNNPLETELQSFINILNDENGIMIDPKDSFSALYLALALLESGKTASPKKIDFNADELINKLSANTPLAK